jgi:hypothetical protein
LCEDDVPVGCAHLKIGASTGEPSPIGQDIVDAAITRFDQDISLTIFDGREVGIRVQGTDDLGRYSHAGVMVYVDLGQRLTKVAEVTGTGTVIDGSSDRLLVLDTASSRDTEAGLLKIQNRATGQTTDVLSRKRLELSDAHLTSRGAVFQAREEATNSTLAHEWRDNMLLNLGRATAHIVVDGPYFIWGTVNGALHRKNHESGATVDVPDAAPTGSADVGPNGDVVYRSPAGEIRRFRDGVSTMVADPDPDPALTLGLPQTDGLNVVYVKGEFGQSVRPEFSLLAFTEVGTETLVPLQEMRGPSLDINYRLNGGWIAYTKPATGGAVQVWVRDPTGSHTQISFFSGESVIEELSADGRVVFSNPAGQTIRRRYLWMPGGSVTEISSGLGRPKFIDGQLHVILGNALLRVN